MSTNVCIIDYGAGNVSSVFNIFKHVFNDVKVSNSPEDLEKATHIVLPGVGAFGAAMEKIRKLSLLELLEKNVIQEKKPFLGICVGMQILADKGYEFGENDGLGWIPGETIQIDSQGLILPHVGWNNSKIQKPCPLLDELSDDTDFYFVNSFHFQPKSAEHINAACEYGQIFASVVSRDNIFGVQFHPEKSQSAGMKLIENFLTVR